MVEDHAPVHGAVLHQAIAGHHVVADVLLEARGVHQIAHSDAAARDLIFVRRTDAAGRRSNLPFAPPGFREQVQIAVIRQNQVRFVADHEAAGRVDAVLRQLIDLGKERRQVDDKTVADDAGDPGMKDAGGNQPEDKLCSVDVHGVSGVVSALIPRHDIERLAKEIDDFSLAFVAPLRADDGEVFHGARRLARRLGNCSKGGHGL